MSSSINTNIAAFFAQANIASASTLASSNVARLSSGNRIVQASDDVTALAIGTALGTQISGLKTAATNAAQGTSLLQVADGALAQIQAILQQQQSIAQQAQSGTLTDTNRGFLNQQFQALASEIDALAKGTTFNGVKLIDGSIATGGSNNPLRNATIALTTAAGAATIGGFTATSHVTAANFRLDTTTVNDTDFIGDLSGGVFSAVTNAAAGTNGLSVAYAINGAVYTGTVSSGDTTLTLDNGTGAVTFTVALQAAATTLTELTNAFSGATAYAIHKVATTLATDDNGNDIAGSAISATSTAGTLLNGFDGSKITFQSALFDDDQLPPISHWSATGFGGNTVFSVIVDGVTYSTDAGAITNSTTTLSTANFSGAGNGKFVLYKKGDNTSSEKITMDLSGIGSNALITTSSNVQTVVDALNTVFGSGGQSGGLTFQLGTTADSSVAVNIASAQATALYAGASLDVSTQGGASTAATAVGVALDTITSLRSGVGALETQFNFAGAAIQVGIQNQTAAQSSLLDTDISTESTAFATNQVKLQAGISVLAQANQQLQALLKLIG